MAYDTYISSGTFTSTGNAVYLPFAGGVDWIRVYNNSALTQAAAVLAYEFYWQAEMPQGQGIFWTKNGGLANNSVTVGFLAAGAGFSRYDLSNLQPSAGVAQTALSNATTIQVNTGSTAGLTAGVGAGFGTVVRLYGDTGQTNTQGIDFEVGAINAGVSFTTRYVAANAPGVVGAGNGFYSIIAPNAQVYPLFAPPWRFIINIVPSAVAGYVGLAQVTTSVSHNFQVGDNIRFNLPAPWGMQQLTGQFGTIVNIVNNGSFIVNINVAAYNAFTYPLIASVPFSWAQAIPMSANTSFAIGNMTNITPDATMNISSYGMLLPGGAGSPGGAAANVMYWIAGKNFSI